VCTPCCCHAHRTDFTGRGELADRQQKLGQMLALLKKLSEEFNVAVVLTNQVGVEFLVCRCASRRQRRRDVPAAQRSWLCGCAACSRTHTASRLCVPLARMRG
jgi:hypothetical protein